MDFSISATYDSHITCKFMGTGVISAWVKLHGLEADHSPPSSAQFKNAWSYTSTPQYVFIALHLVKHKDGFTVPLFSKIFCTSLVLILVTADENFVAGYSKRISLYEGVSRSFRTDLITK
jgi:hypothetical protein